MLNYLDLKIQPSRDTIADEHSMHTLQEQKRTPDFRASFAAFCAGTLNPLYKSAIIDNMCHMMLQAARKESVHRFHKALVKIGVDVASLYAQLNISPDLMASQDGGLGMDTYFALLNRASELSGDRFLGANLASMYEYKDIGLLVYLVRNARNFEQALDMLHRFISLVSPGAQISLQEGKTNYLLSYGFPNLPPAICYQDVEGTIVQFVLMIRDLIDDQNWEPEQIYFVHPALASDDSEHFPVGKTVVFDHQFNGVVFPKNFIEFSIENADPNLLALLEAQVMQSVKDVMTHNSLTDRVRLLLSSSLGNASTKSDDIAQALGMSRRTLYRRLDDYGISFNELREGVMLELAKTSLANSSAPIARIAQELGYSDASAFNRFFKRLTGLTPLKYRKEHAGIF